MKTNKGIIGLGLIVAIVLGIVVVGGGAYYIGKNKGENKEVKNPENDITPSEYYSSEQYKKDVKEIDSILSSEESSTETFKNQPGEIKSVKADGVNKWILAVDLLSHNPNWLPGVDSSGPFFLNQNTKIRDLNITNTTKSYKCGNSADGNIIPVLTNTSDFIKKIQLDSYKNRYFDITGKNIIAIYEQCLP